MHGADGGELLAKVEPALDEPRVGQTVTVRVRPEEGFGPHRLALAFTDHVENVPPQFRHLGAEAGFANDRGETLSMVVTRIANGGLTADGNHSLAGKDLEFRVTVSAMREAKPEERANGVPAHSMRFMQ